MSGWNRNWIWLGVASLLFVGGCDEDLPTASEPGLIPVTARTVEVRLPYEDFVEAIQVQGGFGSPWELALGQVARDFDGALNARTLIQWPAYPTVATVRDPSGTNRPDSALTYLDGELLLVMDTLSFRGVVEGQLEFEVASLDQTYDFRTANWEMAVDTLGRQVPWPEPGAGPVRVVARAEYEPAGLDTVRIPLDSATVAEWGDGENGPAGIRISTGTDGARARIRSARLHLNALPSINPDTIIQLQIQPRNITFVYSGADAPAEGEMRVGGVPAWRSFLLLDLPEALNGPDQLCAAVGCPVTLTPERITYASLVLSTRPTTPGFQPRDTLSMDARPVLVPSLLPRSPLGFSLAPDGRVLPPEYFAAGGERELEVPLTLFIQDLVRGERLTGEAAPRGVALLSSFEPLSMDFHTFAGAGGPGAPTLRLILTETDGVNVR